MSASYSSKNRKEGTLQLQPTVTEAFEGAFKKNCFLLENEISSFGGNLHTTWACQWRDHPSGRQNHSQEGGFPFSHAKKRKEDVLFFPRSPASTRDGGRRNLLQNCSHDFRSLLAFLNYSETRNFLFPFSISFLSMLSLTLCVSSFFSPSYHAALLLATWLTSMQA